MLFNKLVSAHTKKGLGNEAMCIWDGHLTRSWATSLFSELCYVQSIFLCLNTLKEIHPKQEREGSYQRHCLYRAHVHQACGVSSRCEPRDQHIPKVRTTTGSLRGGGYSPPLPAHIRKTCVVMEHFTSANKSQ